MGYHKLGIVSAKEIFAIGGCADRARRGRLLIGSLGVLHEVEYMDSL